MTCGGKQRPADLYAHAEAFMLMTYWSNDGEVEHVWNSRDGVTPFIISLTNGKEARHAHWERDVYCPEHAHHMEPGDRYFADLDPETALALAEARVVEWWDHPDYPMSRHWATQEEATRNLVKGYLEIPGSPTLKVFL